MSSLSDQECLEFFFSLFHVLLGEALVTIITIASSDSCTSGVDIALVVTTMTERLAIDVIVALQSASIK
jgi:hypothetical protein